MHACRLFGRVIGDAIVLVVNTSYRIRRTYRSPLGYDDLVPTLAGIPTVCGAL